MTYSSITTIGPRAAHAAHTAGTITIIDVRSVSEWQQVRVDGSCHIPLGELRTRLAELARCPRPAFLCMSGERSRFAQSIAAEHHVLALEIDGGIASWAIEGLPLTFPQGTAA